MDEQKYWLALTKIEGLGPIKMIRLLKKFNKPQCIWKAKEKELRQVKGIGNLAQKIVNQRKKIDIEQIIDKIEKCNIEYIILTDERYPEMLKEIYDPPPVLFYKGDISQVNPALAIVGSRKSTSYGREIAKKLSYQLAQRGITVVSGMARGIDSCGHFGALQAEGQTVAVMGAGLDYIYPPENRDLFYEIADRGLVVSEFPPGVKPAAGNFPRRNRIISGLCLGVVVIEASASSGSLITANLALEQGREVFAVPGNIDRNGSKGTNNLIKKGAKMVTDINDITEELFLYNEIKENNSKKNKNNYPQLSEKEKILLKVLKNEGKLHINKIIEESGMKAGKANTLLLKMELKGIVSREAGKKYSLKGLQNLLKPL